MGINNTELGLETRGVATRCACRGPEFSICCETPHCLLCQFQRVPLVSVGTHMWCTPLQMHTNRCE